jgi:DNA-binding winged helix-turn-helix (wHTH) protein
VTRDGRQLDLSAKEFAVLEVLLRAAPAFLTTEDLLEQAWDEHADPFTNVVFVTISRLRRKLGDPQVIESQPRVGYRIPDRATPPLRRQGDKGLPPPSGTDSASWRTTACLSHPMSR